MHKALVLALLAALAVMCVGAAMLAQPIKT